MYFAGRVPRPPIETRARVEALLKRLDRAPFEQAAQRFRLQTLQARYATFAELWDRGMRAREEGRSGPFVPGATVPPRRSRSPPPRRSACVHVASFDDPAREADRLQALYEALAEARREYGEAAVPFHRFADLVKTQVRQMREEGARGGRIQGRGSRRQGATHSAGDEERGGLSPCARERG